MVTTDGISKPIAERNFIASLSHGLAVLSTVAESPEEISLASLAKRVGLKKTSTWRLAHTLVRLGYLHQDPVTRTFKPAPRVLSLGYGFFEGLELKQISSPFLHELSARFNEAVILGILDGYELVYVERIQTSQIIRINLHVGSRLPLYKTSLGRALVSEMPKVWLRNYFGHLESDAAAQPYIQNGRNRLQSILAETVKRGYAVNDEELVRGLRSVASPIRDRTSQIVGAVGISVPSTRATMRDLRTTFAPELVRTAVRISSALGYQKKV